MTNNKQQTYTIEQIAYEQEIFRMVRTIKNKI